MPIYVEVSSIIILVRLLFDREVISSHSLSIVSISIS